MTSVTIFKVDPKEPEKDVMGKPWNAARKSMEASSIPYRVLLLNDKPFGLINLVQAKDDCFLISLANPKGVCVVVGCCKA